jgi:predicted porin
LSNPTWGTVTIGRQYALTSDGVINYDPLASSGAFSAVGFFGATAGVGDTEQRIWDNAIKYTASVGPVRFAIEAQPRAGQFSGGQGNAVEGSIGFDYAGFSFDVIGAKEDDAVSANTLSATQLQVISGAAKLNAAFQVPGAVGVGIGQGVGLVQGNVSDNTGVMVLAKYGIGQWKFYGGYENFRQVNPNNPLSSGSFLDGGYVLGAANNNAFNTAKVSQTGWIGVKYAVNSNLDLSLAYYRLAQNSWVGVGRADTGTGKLTNPNGNCADATTAQCSGVLDTVTFLVDWRFAKRFDVYAGVVWMQDQNGFASGILANPNLGHGSNTFVQWSPSAGIKFTF